MRPRSTMVPLLVALALLLPLAAPAQAEAYSLGGKRWPGTTIRYHESFPASWDYALNRAVQSWHASGANIRFVKVARPSQAQLRMFISTQAGSAGDATLGYAPRAALRIKGNPRRPVQLTRATSTGMSLLLAHELGHVLGLNHVTPRCAIMNANVPSSCNYDYGYAMRCRLWTRDDQLGVLRRYGRARFVPKLPTLCFHGPATPTPANVDITGADNSGAPATITWTKPAGSWAQLELLVRPAGKCTSTQGADNLQTVSLPVTARSWTDDRSTIRALGSVCLTLQAYGLYGRPSTLVARTVTYTSWPVQMPTVGELTEWPAAFTDYSAPISFASDEHSPNVRTVPGTTCATTIEQGESVGVQVNETSTALTLHDVPLGEQCLSFFATAGIGWSTPVKRVVTHVASPFAPAPG